MHPVSTARFLVHLRSAVAIVHAAAFRQAAQIVARLLVISTGLPFTWLLLFWCYASFVACSIRDEVLQ